MRQNFYAYTRRHRIGDDTIFLLASDDGAQAQTADTPSPLLTTTPTGNEGSVPVGIRDVREKSHVPKYGNMDSILNDPVQQTEKKDGEREVCSRSGSHKRSERWQIGLLGDFLRRRRGKGRINRNKQKSEKARAPDLYLDACAFSLTRIEAPGLKC